MFQSIRYFTVITSLEYPNGKWRERGPSGDGSWASFLAPGSLGRSKVVSDICKLSDVGYADMFWVQLTTFKRTI